MNPGKLQLLSGGGEMCVWEWGRVGAMDGKEGRPGKGQQMCIPPV